MKKIIVGFPLRLATALLLVFTPVALTFVAVQPADAQAVVQSYTAETQVQPGTIVQQGKDKTSIKPVTQQDASKLLGLVVQANDAPLSLSEGQPGDSVYVATTGSYRMLVSDQNGVIRKGDYLVVSAVEGIGMKVNDNASYVVGKALDNFDGKSNVLSQTELKDSSNESHTVHFGLLLVDINISRNPLQKSPSAAGLPPLLQKLSQSIANKEVTPVKVYISLVLAIITAVIVCTVLYAGIKTSITSISRNPLAKGTILRNLLEVVLVGIIILVTGLFAVYLILKL